MFVVGQLKAWIWAWEVSELVILPAFLHPHHQGKLLGTAQLAHPSVAAGKEQSQLSHFHARGASSTYAPTTRVSLIVLPMRGIGPAFLSATAGERQGQAS